MSAQISSRSSRHSLHRAVEAEFLHATDGPVGRDPGHQLRMGEMLRTAPDLPDSLVRFAPPLRDDLHQRLLQRPGAGPAAVPGGPRLIQGVHHLAVDVELELIDGLIPDPHRVPVIPGQPVRQVFRQPPLAGHPVHDLHLGRVAGDRPQQPSAPIPRLLLEPRVHQRLQGDRRVPQPAEPVVPIPHPTQLFR